MAALPQSPRVKKKLPILISFSGVDGSGKSTQITNLRALLASSGYRVRLLAFWDNVVVGARFREGFVHKAYKSEKGIGSPERPVARRDKNVRKWYLTLARHALYFLDAIHLRFVVARGLKDTDVLIMDRYIYDELANLPLHSSLTRIYVSLVGALVPRPTIAYLLDADPAAARARKPEYPVEFMRECRRSYKDLAILLRTLTLVPALELEAAKRRVESCFWLATGAQLPATVARDLDTAADTAPAA
jgi:thymidylate kinase